jgi:hypothetical protein
MGSYRNRRSHRGRGPPVVSNLNARSQSGQTYRALVQVPTDQGVNPATLVQCEKTTGKLYFDVTGDNPDSVVDNAAGQDLLTWVQPGRNPVDARSSPQPSDACPSGDPRRLLPPRFP